MYDFRQAPTVYLFISFVLLFAFAYDESGNAIISRPLGNLGGLGVVVALLGFPLVYTYMRHVAHSEGRKK